MKILSELQWHILMYFFLTSFGLNKIEEILQFSNILHIFKLLTYYTLPFIKIDLTSLCEFETFKNGRSHEKNVIFRVSQRNNFLIKQVGFFNFILPIPLFSYDFSLKCTYIFATCLSVSKILIVITSCHFVNSSTNCKNLKTISQLRIRYFKINIYVF